MARLDKNFAQINGILNGSDSINGSNYYAGLYPASSAFIPYRAAAGFVGFARVTVSGSSGNTFQILVTGAGRLATNSNGLYFLQIRIANRTVASMQVNALVTSRGTNNTPVFGWWKDGDYIYIGAQFLSTTNSPFSAMLLGYDPASPFNHSAGVFYNAAAAPTGWTEGTVQTS